MRTKKPRAIIRHIKCPRTRQMADIGLKVYLKTKKFKSTLINHIPNIYKRIHPEMKDLNTKLFKVRLKKKGLKPKS